MRSIDWPKVDLKRRLLGKAPGAILMKGLLILPATSYSGWGAIACGSYGSGGCSSSWGWASRSEAECYAMKLCSNKRYDCLVARWEHDTCTNGPHGSWACN